jgi:hypothetical protein
MVVAAGSAAELSGEAAFDEFERGHGLLAREGDGPVLGNEAEVVGMGGEKIERAGASFHGRTRGANGGEKIAAGAAAEEREKIALVGEAFVEGRSSGTGGAGDGAHGKGIFAAFTPQAIGGIENAAFETGVSNAGHGATFRVQSVTIISFTTLNQQCINNRAQIVPQLAPQQYQQTGKLEEELCIDFSIP